MADLSPMIDGLSFTATARIVYMSRRLLRAIAERRWKILHAVRHDCRRAVPARQFYSTADSCC